MINVYDMSFFRLKKKTTTDQPVGGIIKQAVHCFCAISVVSTVSYFVVLTVKVYRLT